MRIMNSEEEESDPTGGHHHDGAARDHVFASRLAERSPGFSRHISGKRCANVSFGLQLAIECEKWKMSPYDTAKRRELFIDSDMATRFLFDPPATAPKRKTGP